MCSCRRGAIVLALSFCLALPGLSLAQPSSGDFQLKPISALRVKVLRLAQSGKPLEAMRELISAIQADPTNQEAYELASEIYSKTNQDKQAVGFFDRLAKTFPASPLPPYFRGQHQLTLGRIDEAAASFTAAVAIPPGHALAQFELGQLAQAGGDEKAALAAYRAANALEPANVDVAAALSDMLNRKGDYAAALATAAGALADDSKSAELSHAYGRAQMNLGELGAAETSLRRAVELDPDLTAAHRDLEVLLTQADRQDEARAYGATADWLEGTAQLIREAGELAKESPQESIYPLFLADLHLARGETRLAFANLEKARENKGDPARIAAGRAWVFAYRGDMEQAKLEVDALVGVDNPRADVARAVVTFAAGRSESAQEHLQRAVNAGAADRTLLVQASRLWRRSGMRNEADRVFGLAGEQPLPVLPEKAKPVE